ncbi:MAG: peptidylprolyl isomerase [Desulfuromonas sp.]|nr:MAG: peptidylprolyl isomerase [Desulfuromonas sp.]
MKQATTGDKVIFKFTGRLDDGSVFDSSDDCHDEDDCGCGGPLEFTIGADEVLPALEQAVIGMACGDTKTVRLNPVDAYGEHIPEQVFTIDREELPEDLEPAEDQVLELLNDDGEGFPVWVTEVTDSTVTLDANHPLAGETLTFELELQEIIPAH